MLFVMQANQFMSSFARWPTARLFKPADKGLVNWRGGLIGHKHSVN